MFRLPLLASVASFSLSLAYTINAQDFLWNTGSARSQAMGGVYLPSPVDVTDSLITNPAGLASLTSRTLNVSLSGIFSRGSFTNGANAKSSLRNAPGFVPYAAFGAPLGKSRFSLGIGLVPEITSSSTWAYRDSPGAAGANYGLQKEHSAIVAEQVVAGIGYVLTDRLSVGASLGAVYNSNTLQAPYIFQSNPVLGGLKTLLKLHTSGFGWNTGVGLIARPTSRLQLNAAWRSKATIDSNGSATGNLQQQLAALGVAGTPDFHYSALVHNTLPQSVTVGGSLRIDGHWILALTTNYVFWKQAFNKLPVTLTGGDNSIVNSLLGSTSLYDTIPIQWKNQLSLSGGVERLLTEALSIQAGFGHANNPVPASTLSPLTAAISSNRFSTGFTYRRQRWQGNLAYSVSPESSARVIQSGLKSGEYSNSVVRIAVQSLTLESSYRF